MLHVHRAHNLLESITARTKRDHWVSRLDGMYSVLYHKKIPRIKSLGIRLFHVILSYFGTFAFLINFINVLTSSQRHYLGTDNVVWFCQQFSFTAHPPRYHYRADRPAQNFIDGD